MWGSDLVLLGFSAWFISPEDGRKGWEQPGPGDRHAGLHHPLWWTVWSYSPLWAAVQGGFWDFVPFKVPVVLPLQQDKKFSRSAREGEVREGQTGDQEANHKPDMSTTELPRPPWPVSSFGPAHSLCVGSRAELLCPGQAYNGTGVGHLIPGPPSTGLAASLVVA